MTHLAAILHAPFGLFQWGTGLFAQYLFILFMGILSAALALALFKRLSRQSRLIRLRKRIWGTILQLHLYPDRLGVLIGSLLSVIADTVRSLGESVVPLAVISIPIMVVMLEVNIRCGYEAFAPGNTFVITVYVDDITALDRLDIETSKNVTIETAALRIPEAGLVLWRARIVEVGEQITGSVRIKDSVDGTSAEKTLAIGQRFRRFAPIIRRWSFPAGLIHNAEGFLPVTSPVRYIGVSYSRMQYPFFGWHVDAVVLYVIVTLIAGAILKPLMRVAL